MEITPKEVVVEGGTRLPADAIVYATGYASMNGWVADLVSQDVADKVGKVWGLGSGGRLPDKRGEGKTVAGQCELGQQGGAGDARLHHG